MSVYVYRTSFASSTFNIYAPKVGDQRAVPRLVEKQITINGGAGVAHSQKINQKNFDPQNIAPSLHTPRGVVTVVSDEDFALLLQDKTFQKALEKKFITYDKKEVDVEKKLSSGALVEDKKGPLTPNSLKPDAKGNPDDNRLKNGEFPKTTAKETS